LVDGDLGPSAMLRITLRFNLGDSAPGEIDRIISRGEVLGVFCFFLLIFGLIWGPPRADKYFVAGKCQVSVAEYVLLTGMVVWSGFLGKRA